MKPHHAKRKANRQKFQHKPPPAAASAAKTARTDNVSASPALQAAIKAADTHKNTAPKKKPASAAGKDKGKKPQHTAAPSARAAQNTPPPKPKGHTAGKGKKKRKQAARPAQARDTAVKKTAAAPKTPPKSQQPGAPKKQPAVTAPAAVTAARQTRKHAWQLSAAFGLSALICVWLAQNSIHAYWQQTYHRDSPLSALSGTALWRAGGQLYAAAERALRQPRTSGTPVPAPVADTGTPAAQDASGLPEQPAADAHSASAPANPTPPPVVLHSGDTVLFAGDSMMDSVAPHLQRRLKSEYRINSLNLSRQSTGLAYPSLFDWPATIEQTLAQNPGIKLLVVFLGPNDPWDFPDPAGGRSYLVFESPPWEAEYRRRIRRIVQAAETAGVQLVWMGVPHMKSAKLNRQMRYLDSLYADEIQGRAVWLPTAALLDEGSGEYRDTIAIDGKNQRIRSKDGIHFTLTGQKYLADALARRLSLPAPDTGTDAPKP